MDIAMIDQFRAFRIDPASASAAYPLILLHDASVTPRKWRIFVRRRCRTRSGRSGMIAMRDTRGITHAVLSYRIDIDLHARKRLCICDLVIAHMPGSGIDDAVNICIGRIAGKLDCQTITIEQLFSPRTGNPTDCSTVPSLRNGMQIPIIARQH